MKHLSQPDKALDYIAEHPGCSLTKIIWATKIPRKSLASLLNKLASDRTLRREGETGKYRYYLCNPGQKRVTAKSRPANYNHNEVNPLTTLFNERLASVRGGRAEA